MDGPEALRTLKQTPSTKDIPVLVISSFSKEYGEKLIQEGAAGYFERGSMTPETLENAIAAMIGTRVAFRGAFGPQEGSRRLNPRS